MMVDVDRIKTDIDLVDYVEMATGQMPKKTGKSWFFNPCPVCDGNDHFSVTNSNGVWLFSSFSTSRGCEGMGGTIIDFVEQVEGITGFKNVVAHLSKHYAWIETASALDEAPKSKPKSKPKQKPEKTEKKKTALPLPDLRSEFEKLYSTNDRSFYFNRGLSDEIQKEYMLSYHSDGLDYFINRYEELTGDKSRYNESYSAFIPIFDPDGSIRHFIPYLDEDKALPGQNTNLKNKKLKDREDRLFNDRYLTTSPDTIFVTESVFDALSIEDCSKYPAIGLNSVANADRLIESIKSNKDKLSATTFVLALDNDQAGIKATKKLSNQLDQIGINHSIFAFDPEYKDVNDLLQVDRIRLEQAIKKFEAERETEQLEKLHNASTMLDGFFAEIGKNLDTKGIKTGFPILDKKLGGGLYPGLYTLGAISSLGKTTMALQIADNVAASGHDVIFFSLEMSAHEVMAKSFSRLSFEAAQDMGEKDLIYSTRDILNGRPMMPIPGITQDQQAKHFEAIEKKYSHIQRNMYLIEGNFNADLSFIRNKVAYHTQIRKTKPVVIVDYLQILLPESDRLTDKQAIDRSIVGLKRLSREFDVPVILVSSFNRQNYSKTVSYSSFKESGAKHRWLTVGKPTGKLTA